MAAGIVPVHQTWFGRGADLVQQCLGCQYAQLLPVQLCEVGRCREIGGGQKLPGSMGAAEGAVLSGAHQAPSGGMAWLLPPQLALNRV